MPPSGGTTRSCSPVARIVIDDPLHPERLATDRSGDFVIALARSSDGILVTGDEQLLQLRIPGLAIHSPRSFLEALKG